MMPIQSSRSNAVDILFTLPPAGGLGTDQRLVWIGHDQIPDWKWDVVPFRQHVHGLVDRRGRGDDAEDLLSVKEQCHAHAVVETFDVTIARRPEPEAVGPSYRDLPFDVLDALRAVP